MIEVSKFFSKKAPKPTITEETIRLAYQLFLDRIPSAAEVSQMDGKHKTLTDLRRSFLNSPEFRTKQSGQQHSTKSNAGGLNDRVLIHLHVPKTAGTSLSRILALSFPEEERRDLNEGDINSFKALPEMERQALRFVFGHLSHGVAHLFSQDHLYICTLRRPGPRIISYYDYLRRTEDHPAQKVIAEHNMSFGAFLEWVSDPENPQRFEVDNGQMRRLAGLGAHQRGDPDVDLLQQALSNLLRPDMIYGLTEHFDHFLKTLFERKLIVVKGNTRQNVSPHPADLEETIAGLSSHQKDIYDAFTRWDEILYQVAEKFYFLRNP